MDGVSNDEKALYCFLYIFRVPIPQLLILLDPENPDVQRSAINRLGELHADEAIPQLLILLDSNRIRVQHSVIQALGTMKAIEIVPKLTQFLKSDDTQLQVMAKVALQKTSDE